MFFSTAYNSRSSITEISNQLSDEKYNKKHSELGDGMINILAIDNSEIFLTLNPADSQGLSISVCHNEIAGLNKAIELNPSVIFLGYQMRKQQTPEYIDLLINGCINTKVVILADQLDDNDLIDCLIAGAKGYANRVALNDQFSKLIRVIIAGEAWVSRRMVSKVLDRLRAMVRQ